MKLGQHTLDANSPAYVIAEIGINHEGDLDACLKLVEEAARAGANAVKLQTSDPDENYSPAHPSYALYARSRLNREETAKVFEVARRLGVDAFTTTGFSDLDWIEELDPVAYKISSGLITHIPLIARLASMKRPLLISTGFSEVDDIDNAISAVRSAGSSEFLVMQCTSLYPAPIETLSLRTISWLGDRYDTCGGFSDHTRDVFIPALAVAHGARAIEKHFSLNPKQEGFDHGISLDPREFGEMVRLIRMAEAARGEPAKILHPSQHDVALRMRRGLVAKQDLAEGHVVTADDIAVMRPHDGQKALSYSQIGLILGRPTKSAVKKWASITSDTVS